MEQGRMQPTPMEINPMEMNKTASWVAVAELQMNDSQEVLNSGIIAVNHKMVKPCERQEILSQH